MQRSGAVERSERPPLRHRRDACGVTPRLSGWQAAMGASCFASGAALDRRGGVIASWPQCDVLLAPLWLSGDRCGSLDSIALCCCLLSVLMAQLRRAATFRFYRLRLKLDQRTRHGPHRCALSLKRAAVARSSVAHTTLGWHCCSPERRGPAGTQVTRAVEKWSQRSLSLLVCAGGHLWPPRAARRIVHAPTVRRPSPLKTREAAQG